MSDPAVTVADRAAPRVVDRRVPPRTLECLLRDVLGGPGIADDGQRHAEDDPLEPAHERERELGVARAEAREQRFVGWSLA